MSIMTQQPDCNGETNSRSFTEMTSVASSEPLETPQSRTKGDNSGANTYTGCYCGDTNSLGPKETTPEPTHTPAVTVETPTMTNGVAALSANVVISATVQKVVVDLPTVNFNVVVVGTSAVVAMNVVMAGIVVILCQVCTAAKDVAADVVIVEVVTVEVVIVGVVIVEVVIVGVVIVGVVNVVHVIWGTLIVQYYKLSKFVQ